MYQGVYINLDRAATRRELLERQLAEAGLSGRYERFPAIDGKEISYGPDRLPGSAALGCTLSHLSAIKKYHDPGRHLHVLEDDALLHPEVGRVFRSFLDLRGAEQWDLFMTDLFLPPDLYLFKFLHRKYREASRDGSVAFLDVGAWDFAGASSYFVNGGSKEKFLQMMEHSFQPEAPYDLRIRELARKGMLKVYVCFPFFSTVSEESRNSNIAGSFRHVLPLTEYRRSFYVAADHERVIARLAEERPKDPDLHMQIYLNLTACLIDEGHERF